jgi:excisionase family DNA binding protein
LAEPNYEHPAVLISFELDRRTAGAIVVADHLLRAELERQGRPVPDGFEQLAALAARVVNSGQQGTDADTDLAAVAAHGNTRPMTVTEAASHYQVSVRTIRRWVASGELPAERHGRTVRIPNRKE